MEEWRRGLALDPEILSKSSSNSLIGGSTPSKERSYFMARLHATAGNVPMVIEHLERAFIEGFTDIAAIQKEPDFDPIRKDERFVEFMKKLELLIKLKSAGAQEGEVTSAPPGQAPDVGIPKPKITIGTRP
jgi:hypothetical protein